MNHGGASVSWLTLNEEAKDLFVGEIEMSGSHFHNWANMDETLKYSQKLLDEFDSFEKLKFATIKEIKNVTDKIVSFHIFSGLRSAPAPPGAELGAKF